ncbi:alpha/beta hydrolase [Streptomyces synnematoformans]|uniref:Peptidase S33 tripeptidyl aminopeptidase-like C-terminal domain-containing protein n=1 Tax=Streptomyces synnematoformans TaxID=415721 RepID=A0ABN2Y5P6_9ACTN
MTVPLDYAEPDGRTIELAISRVAARDTDRGHGILLSNTGGPGGAGLGFTHRVGTALGDTAAGYDLINAALLPHASSRNVARDMDLIRAVLGEPALSYYGVSYGADLGAVYTQLFPGHADRIVPDSSTDPTATQYELFQRSGEPTEQALDQWAAWTAERDGEHGLGTTRAEVRATVERLVAQAERRPFRTGDYRVDAFQLRLILRQFIQHEDNDAALAQAVRELTDAAAGEQVEPDGAFGMWLELLNSPDLDSVFAVPAFTMCADGGWPAGGFPDDAETYWRDMENSRATQPVFGPAANAVSPCTFWNTEPLEPGTEIGNDAPALMLQAGGDVNTLHESAVELHRRLTGSRLVTADIRAHGVFGRGEDGLRPVPCAEEAVQAYLRDGTLPAEDVTCPHP